MAAPQLQRRYTPEEYLAHERQAAYKSEFIAGQIVAMSGASRVHNRITMNLARVLDTQTLDGPCETYGSDQRVKVRASGMYTYPDFTVVCGQPQFEDDHVDTLLNPTLIIEVLSPSTELYDRVAKFGYYRQLPSLQEYLLIAQDRMLIEHYVRTDNGWLFTPTTDPAAVLELPAINCELPVAEVYRRVSFAAEPESGPDGAGTAEAAEA